MKFIHLTLFLFTFALGANDVHACSCKEKPSVLEAYESAEMVLVARLASVTKVPAAPNQESYYADDIRSVTVVVEKIYKGNTRVRHELTVQQGTGADCVWNYSERDIGEKYLFYFKRAAEADVWFASTCSRSNRLEDAKEDLLYLDNIKKHRGKTRVSGKYHKYFGNASEVANRTILIRGEKETYETKTDDRGVFEIYDLPAGEYKLEPAPPTGWRLVVNRRQILEPATLTSKPFTLAARKHVTFDLFFEPDTGIEGTVIGPDGNPLNGVCTNLISRFRAGTVAMTSCTDHDGRFRFEGIPAATYVLVANLDDRISTRNPFRAIYYANATEFEKATPIVVREGERVKGINLVISKLYETISVEGVVKYSDDNPVAGRPVRFKSFVTKGYDGDKYVLTDANGRFRLRLLKGLKGEMFADMFARSGEYENCPLMAALIIASADQQTYLKTSSVLIDADKDIELLELRFPFPKCERR